MEQILGTSDYIKFFSGIFFALIGVAVFKLMELSQRDYLSERTPVIFRWGFWFHDNWRDLLTAILLVFITVRFSQDIITYFFSDIIKVDGFKDGMFMYLLVGLLHGKIVRAIRKLVYVPKQTENN